MINDKSTASVRMTRAMRLCFLASVLHQNILCGHQRIAHELASVKVLAIHIHAADSSVSVGGVVIYPRTGAEA